jgi:hypothetical protein
LVNALSHSLLAVAVGSVVTTILAGRPDIAVGLLAGLLSAGGATLAGLLKGPSMRRRARVVTALLLAIALALMLSSTSPLGLALAFALLSHMGSSALGQLARRWSRTGHLPSADDPLQNVYVSLPSLAVLVSLLVMAPL